jgi:hypothetical protein
MQLRLKSRVGGVILFPLLLRIKYTAKKNLFEVSKQLCMTRLNFILFSLQRGAKNLIVVKNRRPPFETQVGTCYTSEHVLNKI